jgi:hypothetical protein
MPAGDGVAIGLLSRLNGGGSGLSGSTGAVSIVMRFDEWHCEQPGIWHRMDGILEYAGRRDKM